DRLMETRKPSEIPTDMEEVRQELERWRSAHAHRSRIPEELWGSAVKIARRHGLYRTSKTLRLDYVNLKNRAGIPTSKTDSASAFVELLGGQRLPECVDRKSTRLNSSHRTISYAVFCL